MQINYTPVKNKTQHDSIQNANRLHLSIQNDRYMEKDIHLKYKSKSGSNGQKYEQGEKEWPSSLLSLIKAI